MNWIVAEMEELLSDGSLQIQSPDHRYHHIQKTLKPVLGQSLSVTLLHQKRAVFTVSHLDSKCVILAPTECENGSSDPDERFPASFVIALPRPKVIRRIVRGLSALRVREIEFYHCESVEKSYWSSHELVPENLKAAIREGISFHGHPHPTEVRLHRRFRPFVEDNLMLRKEQTLFLDPDAKSILGADAQKAKGTREPQRRTFLFGPEGRLNAFELKWFRDHFQTASLGDLILPTEIAVTFVASAFIMKSMSNELGAATNVEI